MKTNVELIDAYHGATYDYEAAKAGIADRFEAFTRLLVAERVLTALGLLAIWATLDLP